MDSRNRSAFAEKLISSLVQYRSGLFTPERCDTHEPIQERLASDDISEPIRWLSTVGGRVFFKKTSPFKYEGFLKNRRGEPIWVEKSGVRAVDPKSADPIFLTEWCIWMDRAFERQRPLSELVDFTETLFEVSQGDYGFLALEDDYESKNLLRTQRSTMFVGTDPERGIPGIYWVNLFGPSYVKWLREERLVSIPSIQLRHLDNGGILFRAYENPSDYSNEIGVQCVIETKKRLGSDRFFDIKEPNRSCLVPDFGNFRKVQ